MKLTIQTSVGLELFWVAQGMIEMLVLKCADVLPMMLKGRRIVRACVRACARVCRIGFDISKACQRAATF
eukprot:4734467-Amphidinium_carterae.1